MKPTFSLLFSLAVIVSCAPGPKPPGGEECDRAYGHLVDIGCEPLRPESGTWVDVCRNGRRHGIFALRCVNAAPTRAAVAECGVTCQ